MTDKGNLAFEITKITANTGIAAMARTLNCCEQVAMTQLHDYLLLVCRTKAPEQTTGYFNKLAEQAQGKATGDEVVKELDRLHDALHLAETPETTEH